MSIRAQPLISAISQVELRVGDLSSARRFYEHTLELEVRSEFGQTLVLDCGGLTILVQESRERPIGCPIYFRADDRIHEIADVLKARGVRFKSGPTRIVREFEGRSTWLGFFDDPWGNPFALVGDMPVE